MDWDDLLNEGADIGVYFSVYKDLRELWLDQRNQFMPNVYLFDILEIVQQKGRQKHLKFTQEHKDTLQGLIDSRAVIVTGIFERWEVDEGGHATAYSLDLSTGEMILYEVNDNFDMLKIYTKLGPEMKTFFEPALKAHHSNIRSVTIRPKNRQPKLFTLRGNNCLVWASFFALAIAYTGETNPASLTRLRDDNSGDCRLMLYKVLVNSDMKLFHLEFESQTDLPFRNVREPRDYSNTLFPEDPPFYQQTQFSQTVNQAAQEYFQQNADIIIKAAEERKKREEEEQRQLEGSLVNLQQMSGRFYSENLQALALQQNEPITTARPKPQLGFMQESDDEAIDSDVEWNIQKIREFEAKVNPWRKRRGETMAGEVLTETLPTNIDVNKLSRKLKRDANDLKRSRVGEEFEDNINTVRHTKLRKRDQKKDEKIEEEKDDNNTLESWGFKGTREQWKNIHWLEQRKANMMTHEAIKPIRKEIMDHVESSFRPITQDEQLADMIMTTWAEARIKGRAKAFNEIEKAAAEKYERLWEMSSEKFKGIIFEIMKKIEFDMYAIMNGMPIQAKAMIEGTIKKITWKSSLYRKFIPPEDEDTIRTTIIEWASELVKHFIETPDIKMPWLQELYLKTSMIKKGELLKYVFRWMNNVSLEEIWTSLILTTSVSVTGKPIDTTRKVPKLLKFFREEYTDQEIPIPEAYDQEQVDQNNRIREEFRDLAQLFSQPTTRRLVSDVLTLQSNIAQMQTRSQSNQMQQMQQNPPQQQQQQAAYQAWGGNLQSSMNQMASNQGTRITDWAHQAPSDTTVVLPTIKPRPPNFDAYAYYKVSTRRGVKYKAKEEYAFDVVNKWRDVVGCVYPAGNGIWTPQEPADPEKSLLMYKSGWLIGDVLAKVVTEISNKPFFQKGMAQAFARYNTQKVKYTKKTWLAAPLALVPLYHPGNQSNIQAAIQGSVPGLLAYVSAQNQAFGQAVDAYGSINEAGETIRDSIINTLATLAQYQLIHETTTAGAGGLSVIIRDKIDPTIAENLYWAPTNFTTTTFSIGVTSLAQLYARNSSFGTKIAFAKTRGYNFIGIKYGFAVTNQHYSTLYMIVLPRKETAAKAKPIIALSYGARYSFHPDELDWDDSLLLMGLTNAQLWDVQSFTDANAAITHATPVHAEIIYQTVQSLESINYHAGDFNELVKVKKPDMGKYMLSKQKARIGTISAQNVNVQVMADGHIQTQGAFSANIFQHLNPVNKSSMIDLSKLRYDQRVVLDPSTSAQQRVKRISSILDDLNNQELRGRVDVGGQTKTTAVGALMNMYPTIGEFKALGIPAALAAGLEPQKIQELANAAYGDMLSRGLFDANNLYKRPGIYRPPPV